MTTAEQVRVGGIWLATIGGVGGLKYSFTANGGCEQASWRMNLDPSFTHPALVAGKVVEIRLGPENVWAGILDEPDRTDGWTFTAAGKAADLRTYTCLDALLNTTTKPDVAIDRAIADGMSVTRPNSLSAASYAASDDTVHLNRVGDLLDAWGDSVSKRWGVDEESQVYAATDPTTPSYYLTAGSGKIGLADEEYVSDLYGRYQDAPGSYQTVHVNDPTASAAHRREEQVDLTVQGIMTGGKATNILLGAIAKGAARYAWTAPVTPSPYQLTTPGGQPVCLSFVRAQEMVRMFGVLDEQGGPVSYVDFVLGRVEYEPAARSIVLSPLNLAARNLTDVLAKAIGA